MANFSFSILKRSFYCFLPFIICNGDANPDHCSRMECIFFSSGSSASDRLILGSQHVCRCFVYARFPLHLMLLGNNCVLDMQFDVFSSVLEESSPLRHQTFLPPHPPSHFLLAAQRHVCWAVGCRSADPVRSASTPFVFLCE